MPRKKRGISGDSKRRRAALRIREKRARETEEERSRRNKREAERQRILRTLETPEEAKQRKDRAAAVARRRHAKLKEAKLLQQARIQKSKVRKRKPNPRQCEQKRNHASKSQRQRIESESLMKYISSTPPGFLMYGNSCGETITSDITDQCEEHIKTSLVCARTPGVMRNYLEKRTPLKGYPGVTTITIERDDLVFDPKLMVLKSNAVPEIHIEDEVVVDSEPMISENENVVSTLLQKANDVPEFHVDDELIVIDKEPMISEDKNVKSPKLQNLNGALQSNIDDRLIPCDKDSDSFQCKKEPSSECVLGTRSCVNEKPFNPVIVVKQEISESEFDSESQQCSNPEPHHLPNPKPQHCPDSELPHCSNPKCLESISQLKSKVASLEFQLQESLRMSRVMSLKVQNALEDKRELEDKLQRAEKEILYFKQKYHVPR